MNTFEQVMQLSNKIHSLLNKNRGVVTLHFYDGTTITANVKSSNTSFGVDKQPESFITTFTTDINNTTIYNLFLVREII